MATKDARGRTTGRAKRGADGSAESGKKTPEWKLWIRDIGVALLVLAIVLVGMFVYTGVWPPLVVVESQSMQHGDQTSSIGVIDTGDLVFVQAAPQRSDVVTYVQGRSSGYSTYGDYGDVIIFHPNADTSVTPIIHRAILWIRLNGTGLGGTVLVDAPDLSLLPTSSWLAFDASGQPTHSPYGIGSAWITGMGFNHNLNITFNFGANRNVDRGPGYITMGDNNAFQQCRPYVPCSGGYDLGWFAIQSDIIGHARGEIPWFGLLKLLVSPSPQGCCSGWGDPIAPANSWTDLAFALAFLVALPFILEGLVWAWGKYAWPWLGPRFRRLTKWGRTKPEDESPESRDGDEAS